MFVCVYIYVCGGEGGNVFICACGILYFLHSMYSPGFMMLYFKFCVCLQERIVRNKFGTIAVLIFSALLGCQLFVYITENRLLRKQVYKLTESLEDVLEKQYNLEQDHTECLTMVRLIKT